MLITIVAGTYFYITCCSECGTTKITEPSTEKISIDQPKATAYPFSIEGGGFEYTANDNYNFRISSPDILIPLTEELTKSVAEVRSFLETDKDNVINVTGFYTSDETNTSAFPNLGLARANAIKNDLASKGISTFQINTMGKRMDGMIPKDGVYWGAAAFGIEEKSDKAEGELNVLYEKIKADPLILYFNTAQASIQLDQTQRQKIADISRYLDKVEGAVANVVGHTDDTGKPNTNMKLGLERANFAKEYLLKNGISDSKIIVTSKGQTEPIENNGTEEGRERNRRTVITLN